MASIKSSDSSTYFTSGAVIQSYESDLSFDLSSADDLSIVENDELYESGENFEAAKESLSFEDDIMDRFHISSPYGEDEKGEENIINDQELRIHDKSHFPSLPSSIPKFIFKTPATPKSHDIGDNFDNSEPTLERIAQWIKDGRFKRIVVLSGAGVSCSAGIPDFRTPGTGLYDNLQAYNLPYPEAIFDLGYYARNPHAFCTLAAEMWPGTKHSPTIAHSFIALLNKKKLLLRNYTQNIDGLEVIAGVSEDRLVECHGHFRTASCISCGIPFDGMECKRIILENHCESTRPGNMSDREIPKCPRCSHYVKPDIVFFGESLPVRFGKLLHGDLGHADLLIVMGTSLKVAPVSLIPEMVRSHCPRVLFNMELVGDFIPPGTDGNRRDLFVQGECDAAVLKLCQLLGWENELSQLNDATKIN